MSSHITTRVLYEADELDAITQLEMAAWNMGPLHAVSGHMAKVIIHCGGNVIGAYDGDRMVGFSLGLADHSVPGWRLWSHMAAVHPDYQARGIGAQIKFAQREWALANDCATIAWTFDPLQSRNAHFNLFRLGAVASEYRLNHYGPLHDGLNAGMPSDRLIAVWKLNDPQVAAIADGVTLPAVTAPAEDAQFLIRIDGDQPRLTIPTALSADACYIDIPSSINAIKVRDMSLALAWLGAVSQAMQTAFAAGYSATGFIRSDHHGTYRLSRMQA